ncbi:MAG TPA: vWA domain-containing protein, partial [Spirochaetia bacterium]|nr:vWA domain-containing protein [Spirochaetia bacterium]
MKKLLLAVSLIATLGSGFAHAQSAPIDLVVLVDTSESMIPYWKDTTDYIIRNILTGVLHKDDTFHLISFASRPELEISRKIESEKDVQAILARFLLLQPLGRYTDLVSAIQYLYQYVIDLPLSTQKKIIILTDGIHDPPPDSSFPIKIGPNGQDISGNKQQIVETAQAMRRHGWEVHIVQYPLAGSPTPGTVTQQPGVQLLGTGTGQASGTTAKAGSAGAATGSSGGAAPGAAQSGGSQGVGTGTQGGVVQGPASGVAQGPAIGRSEPGGAGGQGGASSQGQAGSTGSTSATGENGLLNDLSQTLGVPIQQFEGGNKQDLANIATGSPSITFPRSLGNVGYDATASFVIRNFQSQPIQVQLSGIIYNGVN